LFSSLVPLIPAFGAVYFWIKYFVDKNNMLFVYIQKQESGGKLRHGTKNFMVFNLIFYMLTMSSFYSHKTNNKKVFIGGFVITLLVWIGINIFTKSGKTVNVDSILEEKKDEECAKEGESPLDSALTQVLMGAEEIVTNEGIEQVNLMTLKTAYLHPYLK